MQENQFILCAKCKSENKNGSTNCSVCNSELLPGKSMQDRLIYLIIAPICLVVSFFMFRISFGLGFWIGTPVFLGSCYAFYEAFSGTSLKTRYINRAERHKKISSLQAIADYTKAIELAKAKHEILEKRGEYFQELKQFDLAIKDFESAKDIKSSDKNYVRKINTKISKLNEKQLA